MWHICESKRLVGKLLVIHILQNFKGLSWHFIAPQNYGTMQTFPAKSKSNANFAPQNNWAFILCPTKLWSNADFAPWNQGDIVSGANITTIIKKIIFFYIKKNYVTKLLETSWYSNLCPTWPVWTSRRTTNSWYI